MYTKFPENLFRSSRLVMCRLAGRRTWRYQTYFCDFSLWKQQKKVEF